MSDLTLDGPSPSKKPRSTAVQDLHAQNAAVAAARAAAGAAQSVQPAAESVAAVEPRFPQLISSAKDEHTPSALAHAVNEAVKAERRRDADSANTWLREVQRLVATGANVLSCPAVENVVRAFLPLTERFGPLEYDPCMLMPVGGAMPSRHACSYDTGTRSLLHVALLNGSPKLVDILYTAEVRRCVRIVLRLFWLQDEFEGQWATPLAFVAWLRPDSDPDKVGVLEVLLAKDLEDDADLVKNECVAPGCLGTQYPLLHGLVARDRDTVAPAAFVQRLLAKFPGLLTTFARDNRTAYVAAASLGLVESLVLLEGVTASLPPATRDTVNLANPTAAWVQDDFQDPYAPELTCGGVCVVQRDHDNFNPVQALVAAALHGDMPVVERLFALHVTSLEGLPLVAASRRTQGECTHDGVPFTSLLVEHASGMPAGPARDAFCSALGRVLQQCHGLSTWSLVDMFGNSVVHVAVHLQVPAVVRTVAAAMAANLALAVRKNDAGFTPRKLAGTFKKAAAQAVAVARCRVVSVFQERVVAARRVAAACAVCKALSN